MKDFNLLFNSSFSSFSCCSYYFYIQIFFSFIIIKYLYNSYSFNSLLNKQGNNKSIIITGSSSGVGYKTCQLFYKKGWKIIAIDINLIGLENLKKELKNIEIYEVDISKNQSIDQFINNLKKNNDIMKYGIHGIVNCAGLALPGPCLGVTWEKMEIQFRVNIIGIVYLTRSLIPFLLKAEGGGIVINISSMAGSIAWPWQGAYSTTKFALEGFTDVIRREALASNLNLRFCSIQPGGILTPLSKAVPEQLQLWTENNSNNPFCLGAQKSSTTMQMVLKNEALLNYLMMVSPETVANYIYVAAIDRNPPYRYIVATPLMHFLSFLLRNLPTYLADRLSLNL